MTRSDSEIFNLALERDAFLAFLQHVKTIAEKYGYESPEFSFLFPRGSNDLYQFSSDITEYLADDYIISQAQKNTDHLYCRWAAMIDDGTKIRLCWIPSPNKLYMLVRDLRTLAVRSSNKTFRFLNISDLLKDLMNLKTVFLFPLRDGCLPVPSPLSLK